MKITKMLPAGLALALALVFLTSAAPADAARKFPWKPSASSWPWARAVRTT